jgi:hypothetical protein
MTSKGSHFRGQRITGQNGSTEITSLRIASWIWLTDKLQVNHELPSPIVSTGCSSPACQDYFPPKETLMHYSVSGFNY